MRFLFERFGVAVVFVAGVLFSTPTLAHKITYQFVDLGVGLWPNSINASGEIAGGSGDRGFLREPDGTMTYFSVQSGCGDVTTSKINNSGLIIGTAFIGENCNHLVGYLRAKDGTVTTISGLDGWQYVIGQSVDGEGRAVGLYADSGGLLRAFIRSPNGTLSEFAPVGDAEIFDITSSDNGTIAGSYCNQAAGHCGDFLQSKNGTVTMFDDSNVSYVSVNDEGWITGYNRGGQPGFVRSPSGEITILKRGRNPDSINSSATVSGFMRHTAFVRSQKGKMTKLPMPIASDVVEWADIGDDGVLVGGFCEKDECQFQEDHGFVAFPTQ